MKDSNQTFVFEPPTEFICELSQKQINSIDINITYQEETEAVNFENADWEINLKITFFKSHHTHDKQREYHHTLEKELKLTFYTTFFYVKKVLLTGVSACRF